MKASTQEIATAGKTEVSQLQKEIKTLLQTDFADLTAISNFPMVMDYEHANVQKDILPLIVQVNKVNPEFSNIIVTDAKGMQRVKSDGSAIVSVADRNYFQAAMKGKKDFVSEILVSKTTGHNMITLAEPIMGESSPPVGVVHASVDLVNLKPFVSTYSNRGHIAFITDVQGKIIAHPDDGFLAKEVSKESFFSQAQAGNRNESVTTYNGRKVIMFNLFDEQTQWYYFVQIPYSELSALGNQIIKSTVFLVLCFIAVSIIGGYFVSGFNTRIIKKLMSVATRIAEGDLTARADVKDKSELGRLANLFNDMAASISALIVQARESAVHVASSAEQLLAGAEQTAKATEHIASSIENVSQTSDHNYRAVVQTSETIETISGGVDTITVQSEKASNSAKETLDKSIEGSKAVKDVIDQMSSIHQTVVSLSQDIEQLGKSTETINSIVQVITDIAARTNLLSLNASIEAARAGEHGKGFAVVAIEVKKLAEQSAASASEIVELVSSIKSGTEKSIATMQSAVGEVNNGLGTVKIAGELFEDIKVSANEVAVNIDQVNHIAKQLSDDTVQVVKAVEILTESAKTTEQGVSNVSAATEEQLASMQEVSASSKDLTSLAEQLQQIVEKFKV